MNGMKKTDEGNNFKYTLCKAKYSLNYNNGNSKEFKEGYGLLIHDSRFMDNESYDAFLPMEVLVGFGSINHKKSYLCSNKAHSHENNCVFWDVHDKTNDFDSLKAAISYFKSHYGTICIKIHYRNIEHTIAGNNVFLEQEVPIIMTSNGSISIGHFLYPIDVINYLLFDKSNGTLPFYGANRSTKVISSSSSPTDNSAESTLTIYGNIPKCIKSVLKESRNYLRKLAQRYNDAQFGSTERENYKYVIASYLGKRTNEFLRHVIVYELYSGTIGEVTYNFVKVPGTDYYIRMHSYNAGLGYGHVCLGNSFNSLANGISRGYDGLNVSILYDLIDFADIDELRANHEVFTSNSISNLLKIGSRTGCKNLNNDDGPSHVCKNNPIFSRRRKR